jgi:OmcA/MtrC family decaheme c-type cytochrome
MLPVFIVFSLTGIALLVGSSKPPFTVHDKAYYADQATLDFVRPGLVVKILSAEIGQDGTIRTRFRLTDPRGIPLDKDGITTPGEVSLRIAAGVLPKGQVQYTSYTTRTASSTVTGITTQQAWHDTTGTYQKVADGEYTYTFGTRAPSTIDRTATHTVVVGAVRNLSEFDLGTNITDDVFHFVPDGSRPTQFRDVVATQTCNKCHENIEGHGYYTKLEGCNLCHTPQSMDADTGNTVDLPVFIHKVHMGKNLPSVQAGGKYQIIGRTATYDYSTVGFPAEAKNCAACHESGPAQAGNYLSKPSRAACGSCHDDVKFATGENHANLPQASDNQCASCHQPEGELEFDISIKGAHLVDRFSKALPGTTFELLGVDNGTPGKSPTIRFIIKDKSGAPIAPTAMDRLDFQLAGPTTDYNVFATERALGKVNVGTGSYSYTFTKVIPADAKGTFAIGVHGYREIKANPGTQRERIIRDGGLNKILYFSVDGSKIVPRQPIVSVEKCNRCHFSFTKHEGKISRTMESCQLCHYPGATDEANRPANQMPAETLAFGPMTHRMHMGVKLNATYLTYSDKQEPWNGLRYPGRIQSCDGCHISGTENPPVRDGALAANTPRWWMTPTPATSAACLACHDSKEAASHALANTTRIGESCAACHGANSDFSVDRVHAK